MWNKSQDDDILNGAAILAFFFLLAVFPAAIFVLSLLPVLPIPHLQQAIGDLVRQVLPMQSAELFDQTFHQISSESSSELLTFGLVFAVWSSSTGVYAIIEQLNKIHGVKDRRGFWKARGVAILLMLFLVVLAIGALSLVIFGGEIQSWVAAFIGWSNPLLLFFATLRWIILAAALLLAIGAIYRFGPGLDLPFRFISWGNAVAAILIALASVGFRFYVSKFANYSATYGSLAAAIILILWMYLLGLALLMGCTIDAILHPDRPRKPSA